MDNSRKYKQYKSKIDIVTENLVKIQHYWGLNTKNIQLIRRNHRYSPIQLIKHFHNMHATSLD